jgi:hypothetical protein
MRRWTPSRDGIRRTPPPTRHAPTSTWSTRPSRSTRPRSASTGPSVPAPDPQTHETDAIRPLLPPGARTPLPNGSSAARAGGGVRGQRPGRCGSRRDPGVRDPRQRHHLPDRCRWRAGRLPLRGPHPGDLERRGTAGPGGTARRGGTGRVRKGRKDHGASPVRKVLRASPARRVTAVRKGQKARKDPKEIRARRASVGQRVRAAKRAPKDRKAPKVRWANPVQRGLKASRAPRARKDLRVSKDSKAIRVPWVRKVRRVRRAPQGCRATNSYGCCRISMIIGSSKSVYTVRSGRGRSGRLGGNLIRDRSSVGESRNTRRHASRTPQAE